MESLGKSKESERFGKVEVVEHEEVKETDEQKQVRRFKLLLRLVNALKKRSKMECAVGRAWTRAAVEALYASRGKRNRQNPWNQQEQSME